MLGAYYYIAFLSFSCMAIVEIDTYNDVAKIEKRNIGIKAEKLCSIGIHYVIIRC